MVKPNNSKKNGRPSSPAPRAAHAKVPHQAAPAQDEATALKAADVPERGRPPIAPQPDAEPVKKSWFW